MGLVTYIPRCLPFLILSNKKMSPRFSKWLSFVPVAIFSALICPSIFVHNNSIVFLDTKVLISSIVLLVSIKTKSLGLTIVTGFVLYYFLLL